MRITSISILLMISLLTKGQLVDEYNRFISDTTLTSWKEFIFSPGSFDENNYLEYSAQKDINSRIISEKLFDYYDGLEDWTITYYNNDWRIIAEIDLNIDSSIIQKEKLTYQEDGTINSECFDIYDNIDSTTKYTYYSDGKISSYKFLIYNKDSSNYYWQTGNYIKKNDSDQVFRKNEFTIDRYGQETLEKYEKYYYSVTKLDSIITYNSENEIIARKIISYNNDKTRKVIITKNGYNNETEIYIFNNENLITILGYNNNFGSIRTIRIE